MVATGDITLSHPRAGNVTELRSGPGFLPSRSASSCLRGKARAAGANRRMGCPGPGAACGRALSQPLSWK